MDEPWRYRVINDPKLDLTPFFFFFLFRLRPTAARILPNFALLQPIARRKHPILPALACLGTNGAGPRAGDARSEVGFLLSSEVNRFARPAARRSAATGRVDPCLPGAVGSAQ